MGIISRFMNLIRSNLTSFLDSAENPEKLLNQAVGDLEEKKREAKDKVAYALADQKKLESELRKKQSEVDKWEKKAILAVQANKDDLAKEALVRKKENERYVLEFQQQLEIHQKNTHALRHSYQQLEDKIGEIKRKKGIIVAKQKTAEAQESMYKAVQGTSDSGGIMNTIERMEEKVDDMQARSEAYQELSDGGADSLEKKFAELESSSTDVDAELLALKQRAQIENKPS